MIPEAERDEELTDRLALELDAVLGFLIRGYQDWRAHGLGDPQQVIKAEEYRAESDALARFLGQRCMAHGSVGSTVSALISTRGLSPGRA